MSEHPQTQSEPRVRRERVQLSTVRRKGGQAGNTNTVKHGLRSNRVKHAEALADLNAKVLTPAILPDKREWSALFDVHAPAIEMASLRLGESLCRREGLPWPGLRDLTKTVRARLFTLEFLLRVVGAGREYGYALGLWGAPNTFSHAELVERLQRRIDALEDKVVRDLADHAATARTKR